MMRGYLKYRIRRALEQQLELPQWIQRISAGDQELSRYAQDYFRLMQELSSGADAWMQKQSSQERAGWHEQVTGLLQTLGDSIPSDTPPPKPGRTIVKQPRFRKSNSLRWGIGLAAIILLASCWLVIREQSNRTLAQQQSTRNSEIAIAATRAVLNSGHCVADQTLVVYHRTVGKVSCNLVDRVGDSALLPIENGGRWLGVAIKELHNGAMREQEGLIEMSKRFQSHFGN